MVTKALTIYSMALIACRMAGLDKYFPESSYPTCLGLNGSSISSQQPRGTFRETVTKPISSTDIPTLYHKRSTDPNPQHACITGESLVAKEKPLQKWNKFSPHSYHGIGIAPRLQDSIPHGGPHRVNHFCKRGQVPSQYLNLILYMYLPFLESYCPLSFPSVSNGAEFRGGKFKSHVGVWVLSHTGSFQLCGTRCRQEHKMNFK